MHRYAVRALRFIPLLAIAALILPLLSTAASKTGPYLGAMSLTVAAEMEPTVCTNTKCSKSTGVCDTFSNSSCTTPSPGTCRNHKC